MERPTCETCPFWEPVELENGDCKRYPPVRTNDGIFNPPETHMNDWCGEHPDFHSATSPTTLPSLLTAQDVGLWLGMPTSKITKMARSGEIPAITIMPGELRFESAALSLWFERIKAEKREMPKAATPS